MAFGREATVVPVKIRDTATTLFDPDPTVPGGQQSAYVNVQIEMSDGNIVVRRYNPVDHFPSATVSQLISFVATIRAKANAEILPPA